MYSPILVPQSFYCHDKGLGRCDVRELGKMKMKMIRKYIKNIFLLNDTIGEVSKAEWASMWQMLTWALNLWEITLERGLILLLPVVREINIRFPGSETWLLSSSECYINIPSKSDRGNFPLKITLAFCEVKGSLPFFPQRVTLKKGRHDLIYGLQTVEPAEILELCKNRLSYISYLSFLNTFYLIGTKLYPGLKLFQK